MSSSSLSTTKSLLNCSLDSRSRRGVQSLVPSLTFTAAMTSRICQRSASFAALEVSTGTNSVDPLPSRRTRLRTRPVRVTGPSSSAGS